MADVVIFRVYPEAGSSLYALVHIFPTVTRLRREVRALDALCPESPYPSEILRKTVGLTCGMTSWYRRNNRKSQLFAYIYYSATELGMGVVTHECVHAACRWMGRRGIAPLRFSNRGDIATAREERFARGVDRMAAQVVRQARNRGVIRD